MNTKKSCFGLFNGKMKEKDRESIREITQKIMKNYNKAVLSHENVIGFDDLPLYTEFENILKAEGRTIRIYFTE